MLVCLETHEHTEFHSFALENRAEIHPNILNYLPDLATQLNSSLLQLDYSTCVLEKRAGP